MVRRREVNGVDNGESHRRLHTKRLMHDTLRHRSLSLSLSLIASRFFVQLAVLRLDGFAIRRSSAMAKGRRPLIMSMMDAVSRDLMKFLGVDAVHLGATCHHYRGVDLYLFFAKGHLSFAWLSWKLRKEFSDRDVQSILQCRNQL